MAGYGAHVGDNRSRPLVAHTRTTEAERSSRDEGGAAPPPVRAPQVQEVWG